MVYIGNLIYLISNSNGNYITNFITNVIIMVKRKSSHQLWHPIPQLVKKKSGYEDHLTQKVAEFHRDPRFTISLSMKHGDLMGYQWRYHGLSMVLLTVSG